LIILSNVSNFLGLHSCFYSLEPYSIIDYSRRIFLKNNYYFSLLDGSNIKNKQLFSNNIYTITDVGVYQSIYKTVYNIVEVHSFKNSFYLFSKEGKIIKVLPSGVEDTIIDSGYSFNGKVKIVHLENEMILTFGEGTTKVISISTSLEKIKLLDELPFEINSMTTSYQ
jgi:hypothetical protein